MTSKVILAVVIFSKIRYLEKYSDNANIHKVKLIEKFGRLKSHRDATERTGMRK